MPRLRYDYNLAQVAREHSLAMAETRTAFGHDGYEDRAILVNLEVRAYSQLGENVAHNNWEESLSAYYAFLGWLSSMEHRSLIEGMFEITGVGVARDSAGVYYYTQLFLSE